MKVLYIWDADYPWDIRVEKICSTIALHGIETHILARNLKNRPEYEMLGNLHIHRLKALKNKRMNNLISFPAFFNPWWNLKLDSIIKNKDINLIIVRDLPMAIAGIRAARKYSIPVIFDMAEDYVAMLKEIWNKRKFEGTNLFVRNPYLAKLVERYVLQGFDHILVVVEEARDMVIRKGVHLDRVSIVSNTPHLNDFLEKSTTIHNNLEDIKNRYSVIYTGGIQMGRGIQTVIEAIPKIIKEIPEFLFVVVGEGYALEKLKDLAKRNKVEDYIFWAGWIDHQMIYDYIRSCKAGIIPHIVNDHVNTTIPNKIFDYMGLGITVIASDAIPMKRIIQEEKCGVIYRSDDPCDLARALIEVSRQGQIYGEHGKNAVMTKYNWNIHSKQLLDSINRFL